MAPEEEIASEPVVEGSWRGEGDPPEGFTIKSKDSSKLYHRSDSSMYGRTKADVWFKTEEDAVAAGFKMAKTHPKKAVSPQPSAISEDGDEASDAVAEDSGLKTDDSAGDSEGGAG